MSKLQKLFCSILCTLVAGVTGACQQYSVKPVLNDEGEVLVQAEAASGREESKQEKSVYEIRFLSYEKDRTIHTLAVIVGEGEYLVSTDPVWTVNVTYPLEGSLFPEMSSVSSWNSHMSFGDMRARKALNEGEFVALKNNISSGYRLSAAVFEGEKVKMKPGLVFEDYKIECEIQLSIIPLSRFGLEKYKKEIQGKALIGSSD